MILDKAYSDATLMIFFKLVSPAYASPITPTYCLNSAPLKPHSAIKNTC